VLRRTMQENPSPIIMISSLRQQALKPALKHSRLERLSAFPKELSYVPVDMLKHSRTSGRVNQGRVQ
jgi:chemotaxis response regulator CheB